LEANQTACLAIKISHGRKMTEHKNIIFVHIPKTAGKSVRKSLEKEIEKNSIFPEHDQGSILAAMKNESHDHFLGHVGASFALGYKPNDHFVFTFLRNPVDRLISLYNFFHGLDLNTTDSDFTMKFAHESSAEDFFSSHDPRVLSYIDNTQTWQLAIGADFMTRKRFSHMDDQDLLELARSNIMKMNFCGITEHTTKSIELLGQLLNMPLVENHINTSNTATRFEDLSSDARERLLQYTTLDNILYEEQKRNFERQYLS